MLQEQTATTYELLRSAFGEQKAGEVIRRADKLKPKPRLQLLQSLAADLMAAAARQTNRVAFAGTKEHSDRFFDPVPIERFIEDPNYLGLKGQVYPKVMEALVELNCGKYSEAVLTGGIGTAKTTIAIWTTAYQLYNLLSYVDPQKEFGLDRSSEIVMVFQSITGKLAKMVDYDRFRELLARSPFFVEKFPFDPEMSGEIRFPRRIIVKPISGEQTAAIGQNIFGGVMDEVNYMAKTENSKSAVDGGVYDQALALYNSIARRRESRFMRKGVLPGILCLVSSKRYPGQFTDTKVKEHENQLKATGKSSIFVYDKRTWEVLPQDRFTGETFPVFIGDMSRKPRIMIPEEIKDMEATLRDPLILMVPSEYRVSFDKDIHEALREIGGVSTLARHPYFVNTEAVAGAFGRVESCIDCTQVDLTKEMPQAYPALFQDPDEPHWCHIDLALTGDSVGICIGHVSGFETMERDTMVEVLPKIHIDFTLRVVPPRNDEIPFWKVRRILVGLRDLGMNIKWVSFDSFQSRDSIQILRQKGFQCGLLSVDATTDPYDFTRAAFNDGRVSAPKDDHCQHELLCLEFDAEKQKIDHPANASKDVADAFAGVVYGLSTRSELYVRHGIPLLSMPQRASSAKLTPKGGAAQTGNYVPE